jgi:acetyl-CoA carboxylase biotin carboxylase subunit
MNTRLQVEHPITEAVTGIDLVHWQMRIAGGARLTLDADALLVPRGHAIECRVYAEDADAGFMPSPGPIARLTTPEGPGVRNDSGVESGSVVPVFYDPLLSKLIVWGADRPQAIARMRRALREYDVVGVRTSVPFFRWLLAGKAFAEASFHTSFLDDVLQQRRGQSFDDPDLSYEEVAAIAAVLSQRVDGAAATDRPHVAGTLHRLPERLDARAAGPSRWTREARYEALRH